MAGRSIDERGRGDERGQAHTLEAFTAALIVVSGVLFALQSTAVTPLTASTSNQHIENQHQVAAADLLAGAAERGTLRQSVLFWDQTNGTFVGASESGFYANSGPPNAFGESLNETFGSFSSPGRRIAYNVYVYYRKPDNTSRRQTMVYMGSPSDNAATASRTVTIYDDTPLNGTETNVSSGRFYAPDAAPNATLYNTMEVRIVVWQM
ncbi:DUF7288 family protein [Halorussus halophilus]|uniref:DUF7288 family protein n=1 Tax=Halorussus halophilus TaxID=2650975 RepID=UPI0013014A38|nr:hypothetical protein [Halorussus halophilus]